METASLFNQISNGSIIEKAIYARTISDADNLENAIVDQVGARFERPVGDRVNNHGLMGGSAPSYDALLLELPINGIDSVLELMARRQYPMTPLKDLPWTSPREASVALFGNWKKDDLGELVQVHSFPADDNPYKSRLITPVVRDYGVGLSPTMIAETIFHLGSRHKDSLLWAQGAYGLGGTMTYRNALRVVVVTRRAPELLQEGEEDLITVAIAGWEDHVKGEGLFYLVTSDWDVDPNAQPWSAPASEFPDFEPGLQLSLIGYTTKNFNHKKSDRDSIERMIQTRLPNPVFPVGVHNHVATGDHFKVPGGNYRVFENNPRPDRVDDTENLLIEVGSDVYKLPIRFHVFRNGPNADKGGMRNFIWDKQAVLFTSNGQAHCHWTSQELRVRVPKLTQVWDRIHVIVELDTIPIKDRTSLFTPNRSQMRDTPFADKINTELSKLLQGNEILEKLNGELIREKLGAAQSKHSTLAVAKKIAAALKVKGFGAVAKGKRGRNGVEKPNKKPPVQLFPNPTTLEGPEKILAVPGTTKHIDIHINAIDSFMPQRGQLTVDCSSPTITANHISVGDLKNGKIRCQIAIPSNLNPGDMLNLKWEVKNWLLAAGGLAVNNDLVWATEVEVVDKMPVAKTSTKHGGHNKNKKGNQPDEGELVAVIWGPASTFDDWDKLVPGHVESVPAQDLAKRAEYKDLKDLGDQGIQTVWLNEDYRPLKEYIAGRIKSKGATTGQIDSARERYTLGIGVSLIDMANSKAKAEDKNKPYDDDHYKHGRHAAAQGIIAMLPEYDALVTAAGIEE